MRQPNDEALPGNATGDSVRRRRRGPAFYVRVAVLLVAFAVIGLAALCLAFQVYIWFSSGEWLPISLSFVLLVAGIPEPQFPWPGVQAVASAIVELPFALAAFVVGCIVYWLGRRIGD